MTKTEEIQGFDALGEEEDTQVTVRRPHPSETQIPIWRAAENLQRLRQDTSRELDLAALDRDALTFARNQLRAGARGGGLTAEQCESLLNAIRVVRGAA